MILNAMMIMTVVMTMTMTVMMMISNEKWWVMINDINDIEAN